MPLHADAYADKLCDPRWQRKRLEIFNRDGWTCRHCGDDTSTLHVHHQKYTAPDPWEEPAENLITLCETCHKLETRRKARRPKSAAQRFYSWDQRWRLELLEEFRALAGSDK